MNNKEIGISFLKSIFSLVPIAGQPLNEFFFEFRGRIKQERLNAFTQLMSNHVASRTELDFRNINEVEFSDLMEAVISRVIKTGSEEKHKRFRDILVNYIENPAQSIDHADTFLDLVSQLNEPAILVLKHHEEHDQEFEQLDRRDSELKSAIETEEKQIEKHREEQKRVMTILPRSSSNIDGLRRELIQVQEKIKQLSKYRMANFYHLTEEDFLYLKQILVSKALLTDSGAGFLGHVPYLNMRITLFGKQFINYIREGNHD